jgi:hypothetical protein
VHPASGTVSVRVKTYTHSPAMKGRGVYLPKSNSAWGFYPGIVGGGSIQLSQP